MRARFITSAAAAGQFPRTSRPEIAFVGRSNVGKSSLLNALVGETAARTSRTPGRTQLINFFDVGGKYTFADLPGYGYARVSKAQREQWKLLIAAYLQEREPLRAVLLLYDLRREVEEEDAAFHGDLVEAMASRAVEVVVVGTKSDKLSKAHVKPALARAAAAFGRSGGAVLGTSAEKGHGIKELRAHLEVLAGVRGARKVRARSTVSAEAEE